LLRRGSFRAVDKVVNISDSSTYVCKIFFKNLLGQTRQEAEDRRIVGRHQAEEGRMAGRNS